MIVIILFLVLLILLIINKNILEKYEDYWETHDPAFIKNTNLKHFDKNILKYSIKKENDFLIKLLKSSPKNSVFLDIGAHNGDTSIEIAKKLKENNRKDIKILAFEPDQNKIKQIEKETNKNSLNIECIKIAVSNKNSFINKNFDQGSGTMYGYHFKGEKVNSKKLDSILEEKNINNIFLMKIDVEGHEPEVLEGANNTLKNTDNLYIEMWSDKHAEQRMKIKNSKHNEKILKHLNNFYPIQKIEKNVFFKSKNIL